MIAVQRHRGPDGEGFYDTAGASLGHCRLSIIDLSASGHQPMPDPERRYWITFNGEIYNYVELAEELRGLGARFRGHSDTEVLLAAYRMWGASCLERLRGMFAFAIWDEKTGTLFAARDRFGIKPFHYWTDGTDMLAFASELKALLPLVRDRRPNLELARMYVAWNLLDHDPSQTMLAGIQRLPPAHALMWEPGAQLKLWRYWTLDISDELEVGAHAESQFVDEFRDRFVDSIALHLRADVPIGSCLSGGLDSSAIVCVANEELKRTGSWHQELQHVFSACFPDPRLDERQYIEAVVSKTACRSHYVTPDGEWLAQELEQWLWHQEEPVGSTSVYAQYCVARLIRDCGIKVVLDGQGADEQLAGYRKFILVYLRQLVRQKRFAKACTEGAMFLCRPEILRTSRFVDGRRYLLSHVDEVDVLWPGQDRPERPSALGLGVSLASRLHADLERFSLPVLLRFEDRNMMAFGVEARLPFLDHILAEWLAKLPCTLRLSAGWTKRILREALHGILPEAVRQRRSKLGFVTPQSTWLAGPLANWLLTTLRAPRHLGEIVDLRGLQRLVAQRVAGERSEALEHVLFRLAAYETWARRFLAVS